MDNTLDSFLEAYPPPPKPAPMCRGCRDETFSEDELLQLRCLCFYCSDCLETQFNLAMQQQAHYPPRCIHRNVISLNTARKHLPRALIKVYKGKTLEMDTKDKTYCFRTSCNSFIAPHSIHNGEAFCQKCNGKTCVVCKEEAHFGKCIEDKGLMSVMNLGKAKKWQRCPDCKTLVEKNDGCNHITCQCRCDFCYKCGEPLNECTCDGEEDDEDEDDEEDVDLATFDFPIFPALTGYQRDQQRTRNEHEQHRPRTPVFRDSQDEFISETLGLRTDEDFEETGEHVYQARHRRSVGRGRTYRPEDGDGPPRLF